eukprot:sb/3467619/
MRGPAMKWGRGEDYGLHIGDGDEAIIKGHRHFTSGFESRPEDVDMTTLVDLTMLKKSNTRPRDHLVIEPQKINIQDSQIKLAFPQNHKYFSHLSAKDIFPQHKPPAKRVAVVEEQVEDAEDSDDEYDVPPTLVYDREHRPNIQSSTKGCPWRTETINSDWRPEPVARPLEQQVAAETFNQHKSFARKLKETHYTRIHGAADLLFYKTSQASHFSRNRTTEPILSFPFRLGGAAFPQHPLPQITRPDYEHLSQLQASSYRCAMVRLHSGVDPERSARSPASGKYADGRQGG